MSRFKDHFSATASDYAQFRPHYPDQLFQWLASQCAGKSRCWDVATGSGQAALGLARQFEQVVASDASAAQLANALPHPAIEYRCEPAERSSLPDASVDLITVAQALHWFDLPGFFAEAQRVLRPAGLLAIWSYGQLRGDEQINALLSRYYSDIVGPCWPPERRWLEQGYAQLEWPFTTLASPQFALGAEWTQAQLLGYLGTWSATQEYRRLHGNDPRQLIAAELARAWGSAPTRSIRWPLALKVGRLPLAGS